MGGSGPVYQAFCGIPLLPGYAQYPGCESYVNFLSTAAAIGLALIINKIKHLAFKMEVRGGYGIEDGTFADLYKRDFDPKPWGNAWRTEFPEGHEGKELFQKIQEINWKRIAECIICSPAEFDAKWDAYQQELKDAGAEKMNKLYTDLLRAKMKFWNE